MRNSQPTILVLGDQLSTEVGPLARFGPDDCRVLMIESTQLLGRHRWHRQRAHLVLSAMRHFAEQLRAAGYGVDMRQASSIPAGVADHADALDVERVLAMAPSSHQGVTALRRAGVELSADERFLTPLDDFEGWNSGRTNLRMEDFYRWQRRRLNVLMDGDEPVSGRWNHDADNREPPPKDGRSWPELPTFELDDIDAAVMADLEANDDIDLFGAAPTGLWPVTRAQALSRLDDFIRLALPVFGAHEDAMLRNDWRLAHSTLSTSLNLGLLHPREVVAAATDAFDNDLAPINSVEGFVRQIIGWREYVWCLYWNWGPAYGSSNALGANEPLPPAFTGDATTEMACLGHTVNGIEQRGYAHHIERLMVLGNLALTAGVNPQAMNDWMRSNFVDGAPWVMTPNVIGMALFADGGRMASKPYASGGAYISRMSDHCRSCRFNPKKRVGPDACPFTSLYWDFLERNRETLQGNHRMARQLAAARRLTDLDEVRTRAADVRVRLGEGTL